MSMGPASRAVHCPICRTFRPAAEAGALWPVMEIADLKGAVWLPGDGKANPTDLTQSLAKGARSRGARIVEKVRVTGISVG